MSGPRLYQGQSTDRRVIYAENIKALDHFAANLRARLNCPIISPARLYFESWHGDDYRAFFEIVIERYASEIWFSEGWEMSTGSLYELAICARLNRPAYEKIGILIDMSAAIERVRNSLRIAINSGVCADNLERAASVLGAVVKNQ